jgi:2-amino-4-hydroxy-6-hydroxymethyldihydropteridine diphosphokinase
MAEVEAWIGLGSNLNDPETRIRTALDDLRRLERCTLQAVSALYRSPPMGPADQPDYINAVARLATTLSPDALLDVLQAIEAQHARVRGRHWGPRTLDLDLLLYGQEVIATARLSVPHPGIGARNFVLYPLAELDPGLDVPGLGVVQDLLEQCPATGLSRIEE